MWYKLRRLLTGTGTEARPASPGSRPGEHALSQRGYLQPLPAAHLLASEHRQHLLRQLWNNSLLPRGQYEQYFLTPLKQCVSLMQQLPATAGAHHAVPGGMVDYTLQTLVYAVRLSRGYMLPPGASAEEQSAQSAAWGAVVFYAALFHALAALRQIEGELLNGENWYPGIRVPDQPYRFRFCPSVPEGAGAGLGTMLGMRLLPGEVIVWLSRTPVALDTLLSFIRGDFGHAGIICRIVEDAITHAGGQADTAVPSSENGQPVTPLVTPSSAGNGVPVPVSPDPGPVAPLPPEDIQPAVHGVSAGLTSALNEHTSPPVSAPPAGYNAGMHDPAIGDVISLMGLSPGAEVAVTTAGSESQAVPDTGQAVLPVVAAGPETDGAVPGTVATSIPPVEQGGCGEDYGPHFIAWLTERLASGHMAVNTPEALIHITGGLLFLPAPAIFFAFLKDKSYPPGLKTAVQRDFERLGLHYLRKGKGVYTCLKYEEENRKGRYEKVSGYLLKSKSLYAPQPVPADSLYLFVSVGNQE